MAIALDRPTVARVEHVLERDRGRMPLPEALTRRLGVESWMLTLDETGRIRAITVLASGIVPPATVEAPPAAAAVSASPLDRSYPVPPSGALARLLGTTATGRQLADLALRNDDPAIRSEAVGVAVDALMRDAALEHALLASLEAMDDGALARALASVAGDGATGLASLVAERARGRPLGRRAARVLDHLIGG